MAVRPSAIRCIASSGVQRDLAFLRQPTIFPENQISNIVDYCSYLESIKRDELRIGLKLKLIQNLHDQLCSISGSVADEQVSHTRNVSVMADTMATIIDMQNEIDHQTNEIVKRKQKAYLLLDQINPESAAILVDFYFNKENDHCNQSFDSSRKASNIQKIE